MTGKIKQGSDAAAGTRAFRLTRRHALTLGASLAAAAVATGCQVQTAPDATGPSSGSGNFEIKFPPAKNKLPTDKATYRTMLADGSGVYPPIFDAFHKAHENITIDVPQTTWDTITEGVTLGVRNGTAPDLFSQPPSVPMQVAVKEGWCAALEDIIPDFDTWKKQYPSTAFVPGVHVFNGKTYSLTTTSNLSQYGYYVFFDKDLMSKADVDPESQPMTWDDFRSVAKKITKQGGGNNYGLIASGVRLGKIATYLAERAGLAGRDMNFKTGEHQQADPLMKEAIELLVAIKSDGSFMPGVLSLTQDLAISRMAQGHAGMQLQGPWCVAKWKSDNPDFNYGVAMPPTGNDKVVHHSSFAEGTAAPIVAYAKSKYLGVSGELMSYIGSVDGQVSMTLSSNGAHISEIPEARKKAESIGKFPPVMTRLRSLAQDLLVRAPMPEIANGDIGQVALELKPVSPNINDIVQGVFSGQVKDVAKALKKLQDDSNQALDQAIAAAKKKGAKVSRQDYVFANWDPEKDYTTEDYDNR